MFGSWCDDVIDISLSRRANRHDTMVDIVSKRDRISCVAQYVGSLSDCDMRDCNFL